MPAAFDEPPAESPKPPQQEIKDENVGTILKIGGSGCVAAFACSCGVIFLITPMMMFSYGYNPFTGFFMMIGIVLSVVGLYAIYYGWQAADQGSKW